MKRKKQLPPHKAESAALACAKEPATIQDKLAQVIPSEAVDRFTTAPQELLNGTEEEKAKATSDLATLFKKYPLVARMTSREYTLGNIAGRLYPDRLAALAVKGHADTLRQQLLAEGDTLLERLLIERIVLTWIAVNAADERHAAAGNKGADEWCRYIAITQRRHLSAIKALATVRRLLKPVVQVNMAQQQINVAG